MTGKENPHAREFKVQIEDVIVAGIVKSYILHMPADAAREELRRVINPNIGEATQEQRISVDDLAVLIEKAKAAAVIAALEWKAQKGERLLKATIDFLRDFLPTLDAREYAKSISKMMVETLEKCWLAVSAEAEVF